MTGNEYQHNVAELPSDYPIELGAFATILGMNRELGKLSDTMMRILMKDKAVVTDKEKAIISNYLGRILFYLARSAEHCGLNLDSVMEDNILRLERDRDISFMMNKDMFRPMNK